MAEKTLFIVKPDAVAAHRTGAIIARIEAEGFEVVALRRLRLTAQQAESFYAVHRQRPFFAGLVRFMTQGPVVAGVLAADNAIAGYRALMGATDPAKAEEGTLRRAFGRDIENNAVHGSDAPETARFEIGHFFAGCDL